MNEYYIKHMDESNLLKQLIDFCKLNQKNIEKKEEDKIKESLNFLKNKAKTLEDIYNNSKYIIHDQITINDADLKLIDDTSKKVIKNFSNKIKEMSSLKKENLEVIINELIKENNTNFKGVGQPLRIALTGTRFGPGIYDIIISLGKEEVIKRLGNKVFV